MGENVRSLAEILAAMPSVSTAAELHDSPSPTTGPPRTSAQETIHRARQYPLFGKSSLPTRAVTTLWEHGYLPGTWDAARTALIDLSRTGGMGLLCGKRRTGKTVLTTAVAADAMANNRAAAYVRGLGLLQDLRWNHNRNDAESRELVRPYFRWPVLVVDEVGVRVRGDEYSESDAALLTDLIDQRYAAMKTTILVSNETDAKTFEILGPSITRRIEDTGVIIEATWRMP
jgi:hypothetical protein